MVPRSVRRHRHTECVVLLAIFVPYADGYFVLARCSRGSCFETLDHSIAEGFEFRPCRCPDAPLHTREVWDHCTPSK